MAEILAEEKRTECPAARALREAAAKTCDAGLIAHRAGGIVAAPGTEYAKRIRLIPIPPCDAYERGRADALAEAERYVDQDWSDWGAKKNAESRLIRAVREGRS